MRSTTRRSFLKTVGLGALSLPLWGVGQEASAQATGHAKYLLVFLSNGTAPWLWTPTGSSSDNLVFSEMTQPLEPLRSELVLVEKLSSEGTADTHSAPGGLTGEGWSSNSRTSVDQFVADHLVAQGSAGPIPSLVLGGVKNEQQSAFYKGGQVISPIFSPVTAFDAVFGANPVGGGEDDDANREKLERRRGAAMSLLRSELDQIEQRLGKGEANKVILHRDSLRQLEERLSQPVGGAGCEGVTAPADAGQDLLNAQLHTELAINAFACGLSRVASVHFGHHQSTQFDLPNVGVGDWHNSVLHNMGNAEQQLIDLERWMCERFVEAANKLKSLPDPDGNGTLYDNTLMVWARDMGDAVNHNGDDMRFVFAGGGGYLNTSPGGTYIDGSGAAHQGALLNVVEAMGIGDHGGFGNPGGARSPLAAIGGA